MSVPVQRTSYPRHTVTQREVAEAWHDETCPEGEECRSRDLHVLGAPVVNSGLLDKVLSRLGVGVT